MGKEDKRRHFTSEFKRNAVQLVTEKGMPVGKVARELDIHPNLLSAAAISKPVKHDYSLDCRREKARCAR